ncbi:conserved Plasmodium protein, unknown function [Plasmodium malariae]|uniref:Uncharacterized protein n=1 Tax=Plasmodium malariae TaxID=5858 RepID=A0A1D3TEU9_PLAMA|nr:conserved Plasmodium protein, unknown function [Plasmodium malariae]SCP03495.1 conserved Plasmodium protein, unknown function [Plasmodium malariae]
MNIRKTVFFLFLMSFLVETFLGQNGRMDVSNLYPHYFDIAPKIVIGVNKPRIINNFFLGEDSTDHIKEKKNYLKKVINNAEELLRIIDENKNKLLENRTEERHGLKVEADIMNANDKNISNLLLDNKNNELRKKEGKSSAPVIIVLPQPLTNQELFLYNKYKDLIKNVKETKNLLLKIIYFERLGEIKSRSKREAINEIQITTKIIEKCISRGRVIEEILEEIQYDEHGKENKNNERLKSERDFLNQKINILVHI